MNEYPNWKLKGSLWRWYLNTTDNGDRLFTRAAKNLVLYTNINKINAFYRLLGEVRKVKKRVSPRVKRIATIIHLYSKLFFDREQKYAFDKMKNVVR